MGQGLAKYGDAGATNYGELIAGPTVTESGIVLTGQGVLLRGTIVGKDPATGKWSRGFHPSSGILVHDVDTTAADVTSIVHVQGKYKDNVVVLPPATSLTVAKAELWDRGVYLLDVQE